jgi:hypothetical protein
LRDLRLKAQRFFIDIYRHILFPAFLFVLKHTQLR